MPILPLFVFGTLRRGEANHHYLAGAYDRVLAARLLGFARVEPLMIARQAGSAVNGELFFLTPATYSATLCGCDRLEELAPDSLIGHEYRRIAVRVQTEDGEFVAWAYARPDSESDADLQPLCEPMALATGLGG
ncbi:MAG: gamma-glutamylcyclotransferase [Planctomycetaceae bacterium]